MRVRQGGAGTAGIWFYQTTPAADRAFVGMYDDSHVGLYGGAGAVWGFVMNTASGNVGVGTTAPAERLHVQTGNIYVGGAGMGVILKSPDGKVCSSLTIDNSGNLVTAAITCP